MDQFHNQWKWYIGTVCSDVGFIAFNYFLFTIVDVPFFVAFYYNVSMTVNLVAMFFMGRCWPHKFGHFRVEGLRTVPHLIHIMGILRALSSCLLLLGLTNADPLTLITLFSSSPIFLVIFPFFIYVHFNTQFWYGAWRTIAIMLLLIIFNTLAVTANPHITGIGVGFIIIAVWAACMEDFLRLRLNLDNKMSHETILVYSVVEANVWLFVLAFVLDMGAVIRIPDFSEGMGYIMIGVVIDGLRMTFRYGWNKVPRDDKMTFSYHITWAVLVLVSLLGFRLSYPAMNLIGMVLAFITYLCVEIFEFQKKIVHSDMKAHFMPVMTEEPRKETNGMLHTIDEA